MWVKIDIIAGYFNSAVPLSCRYYFHFHYFQLRSSLCEPISYHGTTDENLYRFFPIPQNFLSSLLDTLMGILFLNVVTFVASQTGRKEAYPFHPVNNHIKQLYMHETAHWVHKFEISLTKVWFYFDDETFLFSYSVAIYSSMSIFEKFSIFKVSRENRSRSPLFDDFWLCRNLQEKSV